MKPGFGDTPLHFFNRASSWLEVIGLKPIMWDFLVNGGSPLSVDASSDWEVLDNFLRLAGFMIA